MSAVKDLDQMLSALRPELRPGRYVFTTPEKPLPLTSQPIMTFAEDEGCTAILAAEEADKLGLPYELVLAWITLQVNSALDGVGLTAAVSAVLADAGIACNIVAAARHDHLFVPVSSADEALQLLRALSRKSGQLD